MRRKPAASDPESAPTVFQASVAPVASAGPAPSRETMPTTRGNVAPKKKLAGRRRTAMAASSIPRSAPMSSACRSTSRPAGIASRPRIWRRTRDEAAAPACAHGERTQPRSASKSEPEDDRSSPRRQNRRSSVRSGAPGFASRPLRSRGPRTRRARRPRGPPARRTRIAPASRSRRATEVRRCGRAASTIPPARRFRNTAPNVVSRIPTEGRRSIRSRGFRQRRPRC